MATWYATKHPGVRYREHNERKHGVQYDRYYAVRYTVNGKRYEEALGWASDGWTPQTAAEELARLKRAQRTGEGAQSLAERREQERARREAEEKAKREQEIARMTFSFIWREYFSTAETHKSKNTLKRERQLFEKWIEPIIGSLPLKDISPFQLERLKKNMLDSGSAPRSVEYALAIVRQTFNYAQDQNLFWGTNPVTKVKAPKKDNRRIRFLTYEEAEILLKELANRSPDLHDMALLALHCGPRASEIFGLTWKDVDFEQRIVTFRHTKNGQVRHIPMTDEVLLMLKNRKIESATELVFPDRKGGKRKEVSNAFEKAVKDLGWNEGVDDSRQKVVFHTLRHTCASWLVMAGVPLYTVKEYLGHQEISQTERYAHLAPESLQQATNVLNGIGKGQQGNKVIDMSPPGK